MLRLYGCEIAPDDAGRLVAALSADGSPASLEAAAAIRWGALAKVSASELEPEIQDAILNVLADPPPGLVELREALIGVARPGREPGRLSRRLHNPRGRECGCLSDCWCKRTVWGRALRWYVPARRHSSATPCFKRAQDQPG